MLIVGGTYIYKYFSILLGGLVFNCGSLSGLSFSMSQLLDGHPCCACPLFSHLVERLEYISIDIFLMQVAFFTYIGGKWDGSTWELALGYL